MSKINRRLLNETEMSNAENLQRIFLQWQKKRRDLKLRWSQEAVAEGLDISQSAFNQFLMGKTVPTMDMWRKICQFFNIHPSEIGENIVTAMNEIAKTVLVNDKVSTLNAREPTVEYETEKTIKSDSKHNYIYLDYLDIQSSAGPGKVADAYPPLIQNLNVLEDWALQSFGKNAVDKIKIINNSGDSMSPTIQDGDILFVDVSRRAFEAEGIYVLDWNGRLLTKRLVAQQDGRLAIISDNPSYQPEYINEKNIDSLVICGQVRGWWSFKRF